MLQKKKYWGCKMDAIAFTEKGVKFVKYHKKQENSRFNKLQRRAEKSSFILEKTGDKFIPYELFSNEKDPGVIRCCRTLKEVEGEILDIENLFS